MDVQAFRQALEQIRHRRHQLLLVCGERQANTLKSITDTLALPCLNLSLHLSERLLDIPVSRRSRAVSRIVEAIVTASDGETVCLTHIELLFHPALQQDPLRLFEHISRFKPLVVFWGGRFESGTLTYAEPDHPEYRRYHEIEGIVITA